MTRSNTLAPSQFQGSCLGHWGSHSPLSKNTRTASTTSSSSSQHSPPPLLNIGCLHLHLPIRSLDLIWKDEELESLTSLAFSLFFALSKFPSLFRRNQLVSPSAPLPGLSQEAKYLCHSFSPSTGPPTTFSSFLFLHYFHMLPYPLNLVQLGRVELSSPGTPGATYVIPHTNLFSARLVRLLFCSFMVSISTASEDLRSDACTPDQTILTSLC